MARHGADLLPEDLPAGLLRPVKEYLMHIQLEGGVTMNTTDAYGRDLAKYLTYLHTRGVTDIADVTRETIMGFIEYLAEEKYALASRARMTVSVRRLHEFTAAETSTPSPAADIQPAVDTLRLPKALSIGEIEAIIRYAGDPGGNDPRQLRAIALIEFLYGTGARISEAVGTDFDDIDLGAGVARLYGKGNKERLVPIGTHAAKALDAWLTRGRPAFAKQTPAVFINARGTRLSRQSAWTIVKLAARRAGVLGVTAHSLRHTCATHLVEGGADVRVVQELLGHANVTTTQVYTLVTQQALKEVYATTHPRAR